MAHPSRLRYVEADRVGSETVNFEDMKVRTPGGEKLGDVDGFIVDLDAHRAYYLVVDSGGWFTSRRFLLPIGHARLDDDRDALVVDVTRDTISRYPEFDANTFGELGDDELSRYQRRYGEVCCPEDAANTSDWNYDSYRHYRQPDWWRSEYYAWDIPTAVGTAGARPFQVDESLPTVDEPFRDNDRDRRTGRDAGDTSPHLDGRAQPGDVLGVETGGETTELGDTAENEDQRRRSAERTAGRDGDPEP
jgi:hypothetical protein